ncbi:MAG: hypothetical protein IKX97_05880 [Erysipelotrichaceae bacterium]|nr:hypothetical protein [Erysipelotrichaceae bacterium]
MQLKLYKRSTILLTLVVLIDALCIFALLKYRSQLPFSPLVAMILFVLISFALMITFTHYDLNADRNLIRKRVSNGDVALAKIKDGTFVRFGRDATLKNHVYWKLDAEIYDNDMNKHDATIIEKFSTHQTSIPKGHVYVTYIEGQADDSLIIPNAIISSIPEYKPLVDDYEKALKPRYLNAYINDGLILETYKDSLKKEA